MKLRLLALVAICTVLLGGVAIARTNTLRGKVKGDANSRISLRVVVKKRNGVRRPTAVRAFRLSKVDYTCPASGTSGEKSASLGSARVRLVGPRGHRSYGFEINQVGRYNYAVTGTVNRRGTRVRGSIEYTFVENGGGGEPDCSSGNVQFGARKQ